jgi:hypothetical protein
MERGFGGHRARLARRIATPLASDPLARAVVFGGWQGEEARGFARSKLCFLAKPGQVLR